MLTCKQHDRLVAFIVLLHVLVLPTIFIAFLCCSYFAEVFS